MKLDKHLQFWQESCDIETFMAWCHRPDSWKLDICDLVVKNNAIVENVLDVGCGTANIYDLLHSKGYRGSYIGTEITPKFIDFNIKRGVDVVHSDVRDLKFKDKSFDCVMALDVLNHQLDFEKPLSELCRVAKKFIIVSFFKAFETPSRINYKRENLLDHHFSKPELEEFLKSNGFEYEFFAANFKSKPDHLIIYAPN